MSEKYNESAIREFIEDSLVEPYYQPIRERGNNTSFYTKFEVLARIEVKDDSGSVKEISPYFFIKPSKELKIYHLVTEQIICKSFKKIKEIIKNHPNQNFKFSINIQIDDITNEKTVNLIKEQLKEFDIAQNIIFELSEEDSLTDDNITKTIDFIKTFKELGSEFALDDFGTGYSSFHPLIAFDFDYIKFDKIIIENIHSEPKNYYLCDMLVNFSNRNKLVTIAEYVEDKDHQQALEAIGVEYYQGYCYSKAIKNIEKFIKN